MSVLSIDRKSRSSNSTESTLEKNKLTSLTPFHSAAREVIVPLQHRNVLSLQMAVFFVALHIEATKYYTIQVSFLLTTPRDMRPCMYVFNCFLCFFSLLRLQLWCKTESSPRVFLADASWALESCPLFVTSMVHWSEDLLFWWAHRSSSWIPGLER